MNDILTESLSNITVAFGVKEAKSFS